MPFSVTAVSTIVAIAFRAVISFVTSKYFEKALAGKPLSALIEVIHKLTE